MKADISRHTFDPARHFSSVVYGQGQVTVDADLNEEQQIIAYRAETLAGDVIGRTGVPKATGGFRIEVAPDGRDLLLSPGRIWVDGILCENEPVTVAATGVSTTEVDPAVAEPDGRPYAAGQWLDLTLGAATARVKIASVTATGNCVFAPAVAGLTAGAAVTVRRITSYLSQPDRFEGDPLAAAAFRVELDVWHRHVGRVEDPSLGDVALSDAEVATRSQVVWQVRLVGAGPAGAGSATVAAAPPSGTLIADTDRDLVVDDPCQLPDEAGYRGLENQLYRVEVHEVTSTTLRLKWERNNGSVAGRVTALGRTLTVDDMGRDEVLGFAKAAFVEVTDARLEAEQLPGDLLAVTAPHPETRTIELASAPSRAAQRFGPRARRWDGVIDISLSDGKTGDPRGLENGVRIAVRPGHLRPGDYWLIPARTLTGFGGGTIEWPRSGDVALPKPPDGIRHHRVALAVVDSDGTLFVAPPRDHRPVFPALTALTAADVTMDPTACGFAAGTTVQQAIDNLCGRPAGGGNCTAVARPGGDWWKVFDTIPAGASGKICFPVGDYPVTGKIVVQGRRHLVLEGAGPGSALFSGSTETLLEFVDCASVRVTGLSMSAGESPPDAKGLGGVLSFTKCAEVTVDGLAVHSQFRPGFAVADVPRSSCVRISGATGVARVENCRFTVSNMQVGILLADVAKAVVKDNVLKPTVLLLPDPPVPIPVPPGLLRSAVRREIFADLRPGPPGKRRLGVKVGNRQLSFRTGGPGGAVWAEVFKDKTFDTMRDLQKTVDKVVRGAVSGKPVAGSEPLTDLVATIGEKITFLGVIFQGIVVGGRTASDVRVEGNSITSAVQGIHIAVSHGENLRKVPSDSLDRVVVSDNRVEAVAPRFLDRGKHGIFVGNTRTLRIENNDLHLPDQAGASLSDGIRIRGFIGPHVLIKANMVRGFEQGVTFLNMRNEDGIRVWVAEDNVILGPKRAWIVEGPRGNSFVFRNNQLPPPFGQI